MVIDYKEKPGVKNNQITNQLIMSGKSHIIIANCRPMDLERKRKVSYFYNPNFGKFVYSKDHPMKPERIAMAHSLVVNTGLYRHLNVYYARQAAREEMARFHSEDYLTYLSQYVSKDLVSKFNAAGIDRFAYPSGQSQGVDFL